MANSLRAKLSKLRHDGHITDAEYQAFIKKMDGHDAEIRNKAVDDVLKKAKEIQEEQIKNLEQSSMRNGKRWAVYMNIYLGHIQVACKRLIAEQMKAVRNEN